MLTGAALRRELSERALFFAKEQRLLHALSDGDSPSVIFGVDPDGRHGNFHPSVHRRICANAAWAERLKKVHTASRRMKVRADWQWMELDCAHSSDALLMNCFCHPSSFRDGRLARALNIDTAAQPEFGFYPRIPLRRGKSDRTEIDMKIGSLLVEAKLTEANFLRASLAELLRYRDFVDIFHINELPRSVGRFEGYQLIRGVLAAAMLEMEFCLLCDARRRDLIEVAFHVFSAVCNADLRCRLKVATWQELVPTLPATLQQFLQKKYGLAH